MEKTAFAPIAMESMDKCAVVFRKNPFSFLYVCYHCCASFNDIDCTLQHIESHFQSVQDGIEDDHLKSECINFQNASNVDQKTDNIPDVTDTDPEIIIKTEVMESEEYRGGGSLDADNICDLTEMTDTEFDIKMEVMEDDEENSGSCTPSDLIESSRFAVQETLPASSKERYEKLYNEFKKWQTLKNTTRISPTVLLAFFHELAQKHKPTTLWAYYSMLKATIKVNDNIDIGSYPQLSAFLKTKATGYKSPKARVFTEAEIHRFIDNAPDELWLDVKVVCIFGITGACRSRELPRITLKDIENHGDLLLVRIRKSSRSVVDRSFTITGKFRTVVQKYAALRIPNMIEDRFFMNYRRGKCTRQVIGKHKFAVMPRRIAEYLQLSEPEGCKGFSFGRINCTLQHVESHFQSVQDAIEDNHIKTECMNPKNASNVDQETDNIRDVTDTADPEIFIQTKVMESEEYIGGDSLDADNICDLTELTSTDFDIKMEVMEDDEENSGSCTPSDLIESARFASQETLPASSKERYEKIYNEFKKWQTLKKTTRISSTVLLAFFHELAQKNKPSTLWAYYSMLKATIKVNDNIDIGSYPQLSAFLKTKASGYKPVKAKVFDQADIQKFIENAPDELWLDVKVVCIFGVTGACRTLELRRITLKDIENHGDLLLVRIPKSSRSTVDRSFTITGKFRTVVQKYAALRMPNMIEDRFFVNYQRGKCTRQVIGTHKFSQMPRRIAEYLKLPEPEGFSGHSFRRTNILAKTVVDTETTKQCGSWRSIAVIDDSRQIEKRTDHPVTHTINATSSKSVSFQVSENVAKVINTFSIENVDENHETIYGIFGK